MRKRYFVWGGLALMALAIAGFGGWTLSLPAETASVKSAEIPQEESAAMLAALKPPKRERPLVAVVGINDATETTDYLLPTSILRRADIADVEMLATAAGPVQLFPALAVEPDATIAEFDALNPEGADYVIVPAMSRDDDPKVMAWLQAQKNKGAIIIGVCAGAKVVAAAGLLDGRRATTHWYYLKDMLRAHPTITHVPDRRMVIDEGIVTTTGISASMPMMLTLVEAIAGPAKATAVADDLGVPSWDARHASGAFKMTRPFATTVLGNTLVFWNRERVGIELQPGMDEASLAFVADAWSRTYRSKATTFAASGEPVTSRNGIRIVPEADAAGMTRSDLTPVFANEKALATLDGTLADIAKRYGEPTSNVVAMQLEYPR
ncbi:probable transcriptional regulator [Devosia sp. DBB001]|nr:probable transcriptional regulator [Devosia sp. DBB001]